jgi:phenylalanyl-tRNA synthetase beta chain
LPRPDAVRILRALQFTVAEEPGDVLQVQAPPHRLDLQAGPADLIEDLARIYGYDRLPATLLAEPLPEQRTNWPLVLEERVRDLLVMAGLQEAITYALTMPQREAPLTDGEAAYVRLLNPISSERAVMRRTVLAGLLEVAAANLRHTDDVRLFELGPVFLPRASEPLPDEPRRLALVLCGRRTTDHWADQSGPRPALDFFDLKGILESLTGGLHLDSVGYQPSKAAHLHPGRSADLLLQEKSIGSFGQLHPKVAEAYDLTGRDVLVGELDVEALLAAVPPRHRYTPVPRFPAALRDIAVIVPEATPAAKVAAEITAAGGNLLRGVRLFDVYRGDSIPPGTRSLAYALTYLADDRTLTDKEVDKAHKKIADRLKHVLKAQIRGEETTTDKGR